MENPFYQGSSDMLCGLYCAARLIACFKVKNTSPKDQMEFYTDAAESALQRLMESVERCDLLTARKLFEPEPDKGGGFNDMELQRIFNGLDCNERENLKAVAFSSKRLKNLKGSIGRRAIESGACAIVNQSGENHWITIEGPKRERGYPSFDPSLDDPRKRAARIGWKKGLFVAEPRVIREIYAQTH